MRRVMGNWSRAIREDNGDLTSLGALLSGVAVFGTACLIAKGWA